MKTRLNNLKSKLETLGNQVGRIQGEYSYIKSDLEKSQNRIKELEVQALDHDEAIELLNQVQKVTTDLIKEKFEGLASWALKYIFDKDYKFVLVFGKRGNLQELDFEILSPENEESIGDPLNSTGGGMLNVISLILRLILMEISQPKVQGFIIFDESFKNVNGQYNIERLNLFVDELMTNFKRQIIHITDMENFKTGLNYHMIEVK